ETAAGQRGQQVLQVALSGNVARDDGFERPGDGGAASWVELQDPGLAVPELPPRVARVEERRDVVAERELHGVDPALLQLAEHARRAVVVDVPRVGVHDTSVLRHDAEHTDQRCAIAGAAPCATSRWAGWPPAARSTAREAHL